MIILVLVIISQNFPIKTHFEEYILTINPDFLLPNVKETVTSNNKKNDRHIHYILQSFI